MFTLTPLLLMRGLTLPGSGHGRLPHAHPQAGGEPDWQQAYRLASTDGDEPRHAPGQDASIPMPEALPAWPMPALMPPATPAPPPPEAAGRVEPLGATAVRMAEAARQVAAPPAPSPLAAQLWQVELPGSTPGWQLQVQQAHPQAPLALELRVPPAQALQARQQLADLDRRLRDSGHALLKSRLRPGERPSDRRRPDDEVSP
ncbi:MAG: hypothetical protein EKK53_23110 [Burkholderiales bacterium]|nr:MAG: hypothetical protein EKK53_23110 [Burkholderiales bacterium]